MCFCFHKIGSEGATALVTRLSGRLRSSRIVANGVQVSAKRRYLMKGLLLFLLINPTQGFASDSKILIENRFVFSSHIRNFALSLRLRLEGTFVRENSKKFWFSTHLFVPLTTLKIGCTSEKSINIWFFIRFALSLQQK